MITSPSMVLAQHFADAYYTSGYAFEPSKEDSDLGEMLSLIPEETLQEMADLKKADEIAAALNPLDTSMEATAQRWADAVTNLIAVLEKTVGPVYADYLASVHEQVETATPPSDAMLYSVNVIDVPTWFLYDTAWFTNTGRATLPVFKALPTLLYDPLSDQSIVDDLTAVTTRANSGDWFCKIKHQSLKGTAAVFDGTGSSEYLQSIYAGQDVFTRVNDAVLTILLTRIMEKTPPASIMVNSAQYELYLRNVRLLAQSVISKSLPLINMYISNKTLIVSTNLQDKVINVMGSVYYTHYLPGGGTVDALLGRLISSDTTKNSTDILGKISKYSELWVAFTANSQVTTGHARVVQLKRILRRLVDWQRVTEYEEHTSNGELQAGDPLPSYIKDDMFAIIDTFTLKDLQTLDMFTAKVIGNGRFTGIEAYEFLTDMIYAALTYPGTTPRTATFVAVKNHIARFMASKIGLIKVNPVV